MQNTKKALLTSAVALLLCFVMLAGSTFAWFTDVAISSGNVIQSGTLDIALMKGTPNGNGGWNWEKNNGEAIFDYDRWEPGYTTTAVLAVQNNGTLSAKWTAKLELDGTPTILADVIDIYVTSYHNYSTTRPDFKDGTWQKLGTVREVLDNDGLLLPGETIDPGHRQPILVALNMREDAGNDYQDKDLGANFNIKILATQASVEDDSYGNDYDADAEWPDDFKFETSTGVGQLQILNNELVSPFIIRYNDSIYAELPAGTKLAAGITEIKFSGRTADGENNLTLGEGESAKDYDIHIEGIAEDNTQPIKVYLGKLLQPGLDKTTLKLYHENDQMTRVDSVADFLTNNQFFYDVQTGEVVIYVDNFSVFTAVNTSADKWDGTSDTTWYDASKSEFTLTSAEQFAGFRDLVDGGNTFAGKTVKLGVDIDLADEPFDPIGFGYYNAETNTRVFMGTFDGGNHTIYNLKQNGWELDPDKTNYSTYTYSTAGAGLFASIKDATIKNLAVSGAEIVFECVDMGIVVGYAQGECHFENIVVTDANIANYNRYTGGLVGEVSYGVDNNGDGFSHTFKNITIDSTVTVSGLWGSFGCGMGGVIGGKWGDATVLMENVISAPVMDVYNDVVSAYQWYAFRGCGMLIGHTEEPYSDGRHSGNATASFLTCENVKVYYGDWVTYHYYEFENQDNTTGQRYPWVRAEAGEYCDAFSNIRYGVPTHNGVMVSTLTDEELKAIATDYTPIVFDQLYGADRGMYGTATHPGVQVLNTNVKTIYFQNNWLWSDLKVEYWYENGDDRWTTVVEGISLVDTGKNDGQYDIYSFKVPSYAAGFVVSGTKNNSTDIDKTPEISVATTQDGDMYTMWWNVDKNDVYSLKYTDQYKTVKFVNEWGWSNIKIHYWYNDGTKNYDHIEWNSRESMKQSGSTTTYTFDLPTYAVGYVITGDYNGTTHKTLDQSMSSLTSGKTYYPNDCVLMGSQQSANHNVKTIFFRDDWNWKGNTRIHYWGGSSSTTWPGATMTLVGTHKGYNVYRAEVPTGTTGIVFNNNNQGSQTHNITNGIRDGVYLTIVWDGVNNSNRGNGSVLR